MPMVTPPTSIEPDALRKARILSATPATTASAHEPEAPASLAPTQRRGDTRPKAQKIPISAHGRIRVLATYGMTVEDVADLYGVSVSNIGRIVSRTAR
jgi:hypothetical protein